MCIIAKPITASYKGKNPRCVVCFMEESVMQKVLHYLSVCKNQACNKACHISCPVEFRVDLLPQSNGMICFKIAHYQDVRSLYYDVFRNGEVYTCLLLKHLIIDQVSSLYKIYVTGKIERNSGETNKYDSVPLHITI